MDNENEEGPLEIPNTTLGEVSINATFGGPHGKYVTVKIRDAASGMTVARGFISVQQLGELLLGRAFVPAAIELPLHPERLGKKLERKKVEVLYDKGWLSGEQDRRNLEKRAEEQNPGWTCEIGESERVPCAKSPNGLETRQIHTVTIKRWV